MQMTTPPATLTPGSSGHLRVVLWGTYDLGKPRNRILIQGLRENGVEVIECHAPIWQGIEDKSQVRCRRRRLWQGLRWLGCYPRLLLRYLRLPRHDLVLVGYLGQLDVLLIRPLTWLRRVPLVWDTFLSLHDTVVDDRALVGSRHPFAMLLYAWEWLAVRTPDLLLADTAAHARFFAKRFGILRRPIERVFVGAEPRAFYPPDPECPRHRRQRPYRVLFYGQFIPLHGMEVIAEAARQCAGQGIHWEVIGDGQETERFRGMLRAHALTSLTWIPWVPYADLIAHIHAADLCLGIFGTSAKAGRVIPNKVFQVLAAGRALISADTPAIRELLTPGPGIALVPPGDPKALAEAIADMRRRDPEAAQAQLATYRARITPAAIGRDLVVQVRALGPGIERCCGTRISSAGSARRRACAWAMRWSMTSASTTCC
jgi:glycosyltransferase involved in cell wall biosynthesis